MHPRAAEEKVRSRAGPRGGLFGRSFTGYPRAMDEVQPTTAYARVAVECLTLWLEPDRVSAALHVALLKQDPGESDAMVVGLLNLSHLLLLELARERGAVAGEDSLGALAILQDLSLKLPE